MKKCVRKVNLKAVVKGKNEIFGYEEIAEGKKVRSRKCVCISKYAQAYEVRIDVIFKQSIKILPFFQDIFSFFQSKFKEDEKRLGKSMLVLNNFEKKNRLEKKGSYSKVQKILYTMRNKDEMIRLPCMKKKEGKMIKVKN